MERIILYYSDSGKTKVVAETLALNLRCDICQIKDMKKRDGIRSRLGSTIDAFRESKTEIYPPTLDLEEYGTVYIGTPIWANNPTPAIITLIDSCDLRGKDIILFTTGSTSDGEAALAKMEIKPRSATKRATAPRPSAPHNCVVSTITAKLSNKIRDLLNMVSIIFVFRLIVLILQDKTDKIAFYCLPVVFLLGQFTRLCTMPQIHISIV